VADAVSWTHEGVRALSGAMATSMAGPSHVMRISALKMDQRLMAVTVSDVSALGAPRIC
jgi:hypothetical protein